MFDIFVYLYVNRCLYVNQLLFTGIMKSSYVIIADQTISMSQFVHEYVHNIQINALLRDK